mmetsp:Transcript_65734/g.140620  ORF Transcript_65734/g.140620 Transcript_65734/m.140620 type:complete len:222 (+) Transcript_65734:96-761(+)
MSPTPPSCFAERPQGLLLPTLEPKAATARGAHRRLWRRGCPPANPGWRHCSCRLRCCLALTIVLVPLLLHHCCLACVQVVEQKGQHHAPTASITHTPPGASGGRGGGRGRRRGRGGGRALALLALGRCRRGSPVAGPAKSLRQFSSLQKAAALRRRGRRGSNRRGRCGRRRWSLMHRPVHRAAIQVLRHKELRLETALPAVGCLQLREHAVGDLEGRGGCK